MCAYLDMYLPYLNIYASRHFGSILNNFFVLNALSFVTNDWSCVSACGELPWEGPEGSRVHPNCWLPFPSQQALLLAHTYLGPIWTQCHLQVWILLILHKTSRNLEPRFTKLKTRLSSSVVGLAIFHDNSTWRENCNVSLANLSRRGY